MNSRIKQFFRETPIEKVFLFIAIPLVMLFILIIPALQGWDEATHFMRAYQISERNAVSEKFPGNHSGGNLPIDIVQMNDAALTDLIASAKSNLSRKAHIGYYKQYWHDNEPTSLRTQKNFEGSAVYSPVSYVPQALGIIVARILHLPLITYIFVGRLFNAALFITLIYFALKISPKGKLLLFAIAMLPSSITSAATLSPDTLLISCAILLIALYLKALFGANNRPLSGRYLLLVIVLVLVLSLTKQTYFIFSLLFLLLPAKKTFGSVSRYTIFNVGVVLISLGSVALWYIAIQDLAKNLTITYSTATQEVNAAKQISHIASQPFSYGKTLLIQPLLKSNTIYNQLVGNLTWKGIALPLFGMSLIYIGLVLAFLQTRAEALKRQLLTKKQYLLAGWGPITLALTMTALIYTTLYITFTYVGADTINGVQGRYFIPLLPLLIPILLLKSQTKNPAIIISSQLKARSLLISIVLLQSLLALFIVYTVNYNLRV